MTEYQTQIHQAINELLDVEPEYEVEFCRRVYDFQVPDVVETETEAETAGLRMLIYIDNGELTDRDKEQMRSQAGSDLQTAYFPKPGENVYPRLVQFAQRCKARQMQHQVHDLEVELEGKANRINRLEAQLKAEKDEHQHSGQRAKRYADELHSLRRGIKLQLDFAEADAGTASRSTARACVEDSEDKISESEAYLAKRYYQHNLHLKHRESLYSPRRSPRRSQTRARKSSAESE